MKYVFLILFLIFSCSKQENHLSLPALFSDGMVIQRDTIVSIWGSSYPNSIVTIKPSWQVKEIETSSDLGGSWNIKLHSLSAGGPHSLTVTSNKESLIINDIFMGEVWLAAGQSNMEMDFDYCCNTTDSSSYEIMNANYPDIRMFNVKKKYSSEPEVTLEGRWVKAIHDSIINFSAVSYYFAKRLNKEINMPIGIIHSSWGGSAIESWSSKSKMQTLDNSKINEIDSLVLKSRLSENWFSNFEEVEMPSGSYDLTLASYFERVDTKIKYFNFFKDDWYNINLKDNNLIFDGDYKKWETIKLPSNLDNIFNTNDFNGVIILKNSFIIDDINENYSLDFGKISLGWSGDLREYDFYINNEKIGSTFGDERDGNRYFDKLGENYKNNFKAVPFEYDLNWDIPNKSLKLGINEIAIRIYGPGDHGSIKLRSNNGENLLSDTWNYKVVAEIYKQINNFKYPYVSFYLYHNQKVNFKNRPSKFSYSFNQPSSLFNSMINPIIPYTIKGVVFYQGESNTFRYAEYEKLFTSLIEDWRERWNNNLPFYYVQIAPYFNYYNTNSSLRDEQRKVLKVPNTGMVVTLDIGEKYDIHPSNKHAVGSRLAGLALRNLYGSQQIPSGPLFKNASVNNKYVKLFFDYVGGGLVLKGDIQNEFEVAGADSVFFKASVINNSSFLEVYSNRVKSPSYIRYAWSDTSSAVLYNKEGLPGSSFFSEL